MPLKAVFLDLGGTLVDLESDRRAHEEMMRAFGDAIGLRDDPKDLYRKYQARREERIRELGTQWRREQAITRSVVGSILDDEGISMTDGHWAAFQGAYWVEHLRWIELFPDAEEVLRALRRITPHTGLLSDVDEDFLQLCLFKFSLDPYLDSITTSEEVGTAKPDEGIFRAALSKAACEAAEAVYVGDSPERDVVGAAAVGMRSILIGTASEAQADFVVPDLREAFRVLLRLREEGGA